ncbi:TetR/AcrR family transcriptional regulator C-terminal ligand-binding domain-containing protein [Pseudokineococcus basanitobsidens]|uniref:TetR/AcrR family transcriptional regulator C-terminal ligand-binding domain-containing protein n=1 Tax=Pseudokineococcus basanitobsidens TaxID=1926649 RepID=A0ABU8RFU5_9ACTN
MTQTTSGRPARGGRRRDESRDGVILDAALDVLVETGFDGMTVDAVAARARAGKATMYRRWPSKVDLVLDAVARMESGDVDLDHLPDTGSLRGDITGLMRAETLEDGGRRLRVLASLAAMTAREPRLGAAADEVGFGTWERANRVLIERALDRGEFPREHVDVDVLSRLVPQLCAARACVQQQPITREFLLSVLDGVLLPALRGSGPTG